MASQAPGHPERWDIKLSERLEAFLRNQIVVLGDRLTPRLDMFLQHYRDTAERDTIELALKCCAEAKTQFWQILGNLFRDKRNSWGIRNILGLLESKLFHSCLVAFSLMIPIVSRSFPCDIPLFLKILNLPPYHFLKVIEPVLRADVKPSSQLLKRLCQFERQIVESLAWTSNSPLWEELQTNEGRLPPCQQVMPSTLLEEPQQNYVYPEVNMVLVDHSYSIQRNPSSSLQLFTRKVYTLMGEHLRELCRALQLSDELRGKIWTCFEHSLVHCTDLMVDRHLHQLLLCSIYIIAKVSSVEILFKNITSCYSSYLAADMNVWKNVLISRGDGENQSHGNHSLTPTTPSSHHPGKELRGNLIGFYNQVYLARMSPFAMQFEPIAGMETPVSSPYPRQRKKASHRQRLSRKYPIYISPYNRATPSPGSPIFSYTTNSSSRERLKELNNLLRRYTQPREEDKDEPLVKRPRWGGRLSLHQQQLRDVENDRLAAAQK
ncbi:retinoblastoma-like protein 2 [Takifugu rubripes]|uniref:retinoblastoma-like protein 2 n=1 Tax=Takifugu rubripes TaxID=31033 RepID=UPI001145B86A|nr:retinoblastoma-like protein 2 [Takifugu rubripes]